jgi:hypothetical protein
MAPTYVEVEQVSRGPLVATFPSHRQDFTHADGMRAFRCPQCYYCGRVGHLKRECRLWLSRSVGLDPRPHGVRD